MFVTHNQAYIFLSCVSFGSVFGIIFLVSLYIKRKIKNNLPLKSKKYKTGRKNYGNLPHFRYGSNDEVRFFR